MAKRKYKKRRTGLSTPYLDNLWSQAIKKIWNNRCALCGRGKDKIALESHHIIKRSQNFILRHDLNNGICLCLECHANADILDIKNQIESLVDAEYLTNIQRTYKTLKDYLQEKNLTEREYRDIKAKELKAELNEVA